MNLQFGVWINGERSSSSELGVWEKCPFDGSVRLPVGNGRFHLTDKRPSVVSRRALSAVGTHHKIPSDLCFVFFRHVLGGCRSRVDKISFFSFERKGSGNQRYGHVVDRLRFGGHCWDFLLVRCRT
jgi:hypothetical protein